MYLKVPKALVFSGQFTKSECLVMGFLNSWSEMYDELTVSNETICEYTGLSYATASNAVKKLSKFGFLEIEYSQRGLKTFRKIIVKKKGYNDGWLMVSSDWTTNFGMSSGQAIIIAYFYDTYLNNNRNPVFELPIDTICKELKVSTPVVVKTIQIAVAVGALTFKHGKYNNIYTLDVDFFGLDTNDEEELEEFYSKRTHLDLVKAVMNFTTDGITKAVGYLKKLLCMTKRWYTRADEFRARLTSAVLGHIYAGIPEGYLDSYDEDDEWA